MGQEEINYLLYSKSYLFFALSAGLGYCGWREKEWHLADPGVIVLSSLFLISCFFCSCHLVFGPCRAWLVLTFSHNTLRCGDSVDSGPFSVSMQSYLTPCFS